MSSLTARFSKCFTCLIFLAGLWIAGCSNPDNQTVTLSVASSLAVPVQEIVDSFSEKNPEIQVLVNTGSSGALARQILHGAKVDIFLSANDRWIQKLEEAGLASSRPEMAFLGNELAVIVPDESPSESLDALVGGKGKVAVGDFGAVPAGEYTKAWLESAGLYSQLADRLVFFKNEQQVLRAVESRHAAAGVVYLSSLNLSNKVQLLYQPPLESYPVIRYRFAEILQSEKNPFVPTMLEFLRNAEAKKIWRAYGFQVVE
ncbi:MAG: molybdate ABC transporter substrate-binding protein [Verrucomicrobiae bacterium]|nr:molybdate ABC transporter substrate-binding protein [Verrucomicrobiae bacterium]